MNILLVEPKYKNKYPPLGLMKISQYHKQRGDYVYFFKGKYNNSRKWDRIYITTLFTFDYKIVMDTVNFYKSQVTNIDHIYVGGIMASLMTSNLISDTGVNNVISGTLTNSSIIGYDDNINIDEMPLDYSLLSDIDYEYPAGDNFFAYITRGCINKCKFCAVPTLEGALKIKNNIKKQVVSVREKYGDKRNLLLLDNNILGLNEKDLEAIVNDLNLLGFVNSPNFNKPLEIDLLLKDYHCHIEEGRSPIKTMLKLSAYLDNFVQKSTVSKENKNLISTLIAQIGTVYEDIVHCVSANYDKIRSIEYIYSLKVPMQRYVDFNQGMDARELTEEKMRIISRLPIRPFRIAYDNISYTDTYTRALRLANSYNNIVEYSNYILYNYDDKPEDLYTRLEVNISLSEEFGRHIYSFPMKYEPIENKERLHVGKHWNRYYLASVKAILNVSKGVFGGNRSFFEKAFGKNIDEYFKILSMPKSLLTYRNLFEQEGFTLKWEELFDKLTKEELERLIELVSDGIYYSDNYKINQIMPFYKLRYKKGKKIELPSASSD